MSAVFRFLQFVPDPFYPSGLSVAAVLRQGHTLTLVRPDRLPGPHCLGGDDRAALLELGLRDLIGNESLDGLPMALGPHFRLSNEMHAVPLAVAEPRLWLQKLLSGASVVSGRKPSAHRATEGMAFLGTLGVKHLVHKQFTPNRSVQGILSGFEQSLEKITHYVPSPNRQAVLFMEPLIVTRAGWHDDAKKINTRFAAYQQALQREDVWECSFMSYVLPGNSREVRTDAARVLSPFSHFVIDGDSPPQRELLQATVRQVATSLQLGS